MDTANGQKPIGSRTVGLDTNVQIEHRPITQHGMTGMKTSSKGPNRKIADRNYYENKLKEKLIEIHKAIESMKEKIKNHDSDKIEIIKLEKKRNNLMNEVREYEGKLADYNLALDKMRSDTDIINLQQTCQEIQRKNDQEKMRIDAIFLERKNLESQINEIDENISLIHNELISMTPEQQQEFNKLYNNLGRTDNLISEKEKRLNDIQHKYHEIRESLSSNDYEFHLKAIELQKQLNELNQNKLELEQETNGSMDPEQIKQKILEKVKNDNKILQETMDCINFEEDKIEQLQNTINKKEKDIDAMKEFSKKAHKYQQLFERDRKMQIFIDQFDKNINLIKQEMNDIKIDNVGLLKHISENIENDDGINKTQLRFNEMNNDISFKEQQKNQAKNTLIYSEKELEKRQNELDKINNLDKKINIELANIDKKRSDCQDDMKSFKSHDQIQIEYKQNKQKLFKIKMEIQQKKEMMEKKVLEIAQKSDKINRKLNENAYHNELKEMETKISKLSQNIFSVEDSIAEYKREGQYQIISKQIIQIQQQINSLLLQELAIET